MGIYLCNTLCHNVADGKENYKTQMEKRIMDSDGYFWVKSPVLLSLIEFVCLFL